MQKQHYLQVFVVQTRAKWS